MRTDADATTYHVQHFDGNEWCDSALDHFLFAHLSWSDRQGAKGDAYRKLLRPCHEGWVVAGTQCFLDRDDATKCIQAVRLEHPTTAFRLVMRVETRRTIFVDVPDPAPDALIVKNPATVTPDMLRAAANWNRLEAAKPYRYPMRHGLLVEAAAWDNEADRMEAVATEERSRTVD